AAPGSRCGSRLRPLLVLGAEDGVDQAPGGSNEGEQEEHDEEERGGAELVVDPDPGQRQDEDREGVLDPDPGETEILPVDAVPVVSGKRRTLPFEMKWLEDQPGGMHPVHPSV